MTPARFIMPPIRSSVIDPDAPDNRQTAGRDWYLYWSQLGDQANANAQLITYGGADERPDPTTMPLGALWMQINPGYVMYQNVDSEWHYVSGTMWGTLSPDQRPTGLGPNDAGFDFRAVDTNPSYSGREFLWSGSAWVEITPAKWGGHATRLSLTIANLVNGELYMESDRSGVIYQNQGGVWHFLAGTMWGTVSPDNRPADLGVNDAGFTYRGTDQARSFIWGGTAWVEVTPVTGAMSLTHPNVVTKVGSTPGQIVEGGITDQSAANSNSVVITSAGNVGIGIAGAPNRLTLGSGNIEVQTGGWMMCRPANNQYDFEIRSAQVGAGYAMQFGAGGFGTMIMDLDWSGNVGIGTTTPGYQLTLSTDSAAKPGTNTWTIASDARLKRNVEPFTEGLETLLRLRPVRYEYNGESGMPEGMRGVGMIAQEAQSVYPAFIRTARGKIAGEDTEVLATNTGDLAWMMVNAFRELNERLKTLEAACDPV